LKIEALLNSQICRFLLGAGHWRWKPGSERRESAQLWFFLHYVKKIKKTGINLSGDAEEEGNYSFFNMESQLTCALRALQQKACPSGCPSS